MDADNDLYRAVFAGSPDAIIVFGVPEGRIEDVNDAALALYGYTRAEMIGLPVTALTADPGPSAAIFRSMATVEAVVVRDRTHKRKDGSTFTIEAHGSTVLVGSRKVGLSINRDCSAVKEADERLRESESFLEKAQEIANIGSWIYYVGDKTVRWSKVCCRIFGVDEVPHRSESEYIKLIHPDDLAANDRVMQDALASGASCVNEHRIVRPDGAVRWINVRADVVRDAAGRAVKFVGVIQDITDQKLGAETLQAAERQLRESQKLEAIGKLAGGVAHDFNNILSAIVGLADLSIDKLAVTHPLRKDLEEIRLSGQLASKLTHQLLAFSRRQVIVPKVIDLDEGVLGVLRMLDRVIGEHIKLVTSTDAGGACIRVDPGQLEQLIINLAINARDSMPDGGTLTIKTSAVTIGAGAAASEALDAGDYAALHVTDTGTGMTEEVRARIFEPFFTTKEPGKGTGLGLATCYGIVKQNHGSISCESLPGRGSAFRILLPRCRPEMSASQPPPVPGEVKGTECVLVVEDQDLVRSLIVRMLRDRGFETIEACDGQAGLDALGRDAARRIRLVVSDMVMPRLGGRKLAAAAAVSRPDVRMLFISGYTEDLVGDAASAEVDFLPKPFTAEELTGRVRRALDAARP
jgi:two-component system cell cycle sensor histidine kinase/response regulator CckA